MMIIDAEKKEMMRNTFTAFTKETYAHEEIIPELLKLQTETASLVFGQHDTDASTIWFKQVSEELIRRNQACHHVNDELTQTVVSAIGKINENLRAELSGQKGEKSAFWALKQAKCYKWILQNIQLEKEGHRAELDAVVLTNKGIFLIEVKNSMRDIMIDEQGNYYRLGGSMHFDKNIGEKMNDKEYLLREALLEAGFPEMKITSVVVFTNSKINLENRYPYIDTCFLGELPHIIEQYDSTEYHSFEEIQKIKETILNAEIKHEYEYPVDFGVFKDRIAQLLCEFEKVEEKKAAKKDKMKNLGIFQTVFAPSVFLAEAIKYTIHTFNSSDSRAKITVR